MKQAAFFVAYFAITSFCYANKNEKPCGDSTSLKVTSMQDMLDQIITVLAVDRHFELKEADVLNIETKLCHKKGIILYNPAFITNLNSVAKDKWSVLALLAHEIGHHVKGHTSHRGGSKPAMELEADEFAGFVLNKLGATVLQSQNVMYFIAKSSASKTHPSRKERLSAIERGWNEAQSSITNSTLLTTPSEGVQDLH